MDIPNPTRHRPKIHSPSERFLGAYPHAPPSLSATNLSSSDVSDELTEDDVFWTSDFSAVTPENNHHQNNNNSNNHSTPVTSASSTPRRHQHRGGFSHPETFGILAALPDRNDAVSSSSFSPRPSFLRKTSSSASSSSSPSFAQMIPTIPKPSTPCHDSNRSSSFKYQSAPVNVTVMMRKQYELEAVADDGEMLPPHEIVARSAAR